MLPPKHKGEQKSRECVEHDEGVMTEVANLPDASWVKTVGMRKKLKMD